MSKKAILISHEGNNLCSNCHASEFFTCTEDNRDKNPANIRDAKHQYGFCPFCGSEFTHTVEVEELDDYARWVE